MMKDDTAIPLNDTNTAAVEEDKKPTRSKKRRTNPLVIKLIIFILIFMLIVLLTANLIIIILRSYQTSCFTPNTTAAPRPTPPLRFREPNEYWNHHFLQPFIKPLHYTITLQLLNTTYNISEYNKTNRFYGLINIEFQATDSMDYLVLHAKSLTIDSVSMKEVMEFSSSENDVKIIKVIYDSYYDFMILVLNRQLKVQNKYRVDIKYSGLMTHNESGIITTIYTNVGTKQKYYLLYSKFEPIGARRTFPCFDQPDKKVNFTVRLIHDASYQALSNMPVEKESNLNVHDLLFIDPKWNQSIQLKISQFRRTEIPMSIYLLAFVLVKNYSHLKTDRAVDKTVRIWFPSDLQNSVNIPLNYSRDTEDFFERYFNYSSPLPKTDHIYLPDFLSGAMENWGLVTYRDKHLLVPNSESAHQIKTSLMTVAHELAHFWFGNLVTTKTWGEIWLNEGFATYFASFAYYHLTKLEPTSGEALFLYERRQILNRDIRSNTSSVIVYVADPITFKSVFNSFTYQKGQALLVWLESIMGQFNFQKAMQMYIAKYAESNPTNEDFFNCIDEVGRGANSIDMPKLKLFFHPWLYRGGFPIVTVNYDLKNSQIILTQQSVIKNSSSSEKWPIYTSYKTNTLASNNYVYFDDMKTISRRLEDNEFFILNSNGKSYIRVNYSELLWQRIIDDMNSSDSKIDQISKIILLDDAFFFTENNNLDISIAKGFIDTLRNETNVIPWLIFYYKIFDRIHDFFKDDISFIPFSQAVIQLSNNILKKTMKKKYDQELVVTDDIEQRAIFTLNCEANNDEVLNWVSGRFRNWIENPSWSKIPKHLVNIILFYGMKTNDKNKYWTILWKMLKSPSKRGNLSHSQVAIGLAGTSKPSYLNKLLNHYLIPNSHRSSQDKNQDFMTLVDWISKSTSGLVVLQRWILRNSEKIMKFAFGDNLTTRDQTVQMESLLSRLCKSVYEPNLILPLMKLHQRSFIFTKTIMTNNNWRENVGKKLIKAVIK